MTAYVVLGLMGLAAGTIAAYYRFRAVRAEEALKLVKDVGAEWKASNAALSDRVRRAEAALEERHAKERTEDAATVATVAGDADRAVDLLRSLGAPTDTGATSELQPAHAPGVPDHEPRKVSRRRD